MTLRFDRPHALPRRAFLQATAGTALLGPTVLGSAALAKAPATEQAAGVAKSAETLPFKISLAEWSLHKTIRQGKMTNLDFPGVAMQEFGIDAVEYVSQFFKDKAEDDAYLGELQQRCDDAGVKSLLIMVDNEGQIGDPRETRRKKAVENHYRWVTAAKQLGCHSIRVNAASGGTYEDQQKLAADGLTRLGEFAQQHEINVLVENHGGLSSNGAWLAGVMKQVDLPNVGTLPDFGNFRIRDGEMYDRYKGVEELMPYAKAVSAKSRVFNDDGDEAETDFYRMMQLVLAADYHGYVGIEWEGGTPDEYEGIRLTKRLLEKVRASIV